MAIFIEVLSTMGQVIWGLLFGMGKAVLSNLPALLELKKIMSYFTPLGMIALYIGVPTIVVITAYKLIKKLLLSK